MSAQEVPVPVAQLGEIDQVQQALKSLNTPFGENTSRRLWNVIDAHTSPDVPVSPFEMDLDTTRRRNLDEHAHETCALLEGVNVRSDEYTVDLRSTFLNILEQCGISPQHQELSEHVKRAVEFEQLKLALDKAIYAQDRVALSDVAEQALDVCNGLTEHDSYRGKYLALYHDAEFALIHE